MEQVIGCQNGTACQHALTTLEVGQVATSLTHQQHAGGDVPGLQSFFPKAVKPASRDISQIQGSSAPAADTGRFAHHDTELAIEALAIAMAPERDAGANQGFMQVLAAGNADTAIIEEGTAAF